MNNFTLAEITRAVPYLPVLRPYCHSVTACILMQQLDFWFASKNGAAFYKFLNPQNEQKDTNGNVIKAAHRSYRKGDSWVEELSFSPEEFRSAFDKIGIRYNSYSEYKRALINGNPFQGKYYLSYHDKIQGITWYHRNHSLVDSLLENVFSRKSGKSIYVDQDYRSTETGKDVLRKSRKPIPLKTSKMTSKTTTSPPLPIAPTTSPSLIMSCSSFSALPKELTPIQPVLPEDLELALRRADSIGNRILISQLMDQHIEHHILLAEIKRANEKGTEPADYLNAALRSHKETGKGFIPTGKLKEILELQDINRNNASLRQATDLEDKKRIAFWESLADSDRQYFLNIYKCGIHEEFRDDQFLSINERAATFLAWDSRAFYESNEKTLVALAE